MNIFYYQMYKRFVQREQAKCNFCSNWFQVYSQIKFGLNICKECIHKAINTSCFKLPTPDGQLYQVYLAKRHIAVDPQNQNENLEKLDEYMHDQLKQLLVKWDMIVGQVTKLSKQQKQSENIWKSVEFILKNDAKSFQQLKSQTINQIREDAGSSNDENKGKNHKSNNLRTPLKEKSANISIQNIDSSRSMNRYNSKKSLRLLQNCINTTSKKSIIFGENYSNSRVKGRQCSPFNLQQSSRVSTFSARNGPEPAECKDFVNKMQQKKTNISSFLQKQKTVTSTLQNIMKQKVYEAIQNTTCLNKCIELVSYNSLSKIDMKCYLSNLNWQGVEVVKFVKVGLIDEQLKDILSFISDKNVETLVLTNNNLTQQSCVQLLSSDIKSLKNIYLGKNQILPIRVKNQITKLRQRYRIFI